ncbi:signal peptidase I [Microbacterium allomyrinae]|jgi:signal peptidase I|uniref:Signal peptidase I n=1 Tax=Microbacterium allomyrinae TaxID=2830666 RepID=A0A9X1LV47_9MICO|nr:signal peptidase I [Microbacterium allomyrinae]MCC2032356.1 signal peptidase I [Microbacterium allomyrinae]
MTTEKSAPAEPAPAPRPESGATVQPRRRGWIVFLRDVVVIILIAVLVSFLVKTFVVRSFYIPSGSMEDTLHINDRILVDEITPRFGAYERGDIVVFQDPGGWLPPSTEVARPAVVEAVEWALSLIGLAAPDSDDHLVKRIIGLPGDHVVCCNALGQITVNGVPIDESDYIKLATGESAASGDPFDVVVPEGSLWVLGDNRYRSKDSRYNTDQPGKGFVPIDNVVGRAFLVTWPFDRFGMLDFHHEVFSGVPEAEPEGETQ